MGDGTMFKDSRAFSGFSADDIPAAKRFYSETLGLGVEEENGMLHLDLAEGPGTLIYPKPDHEPASFTVLNFPVDDIDVAVDSLRRRGVEFISYDGIGEDGVMREYGPPIAWFKDPAGNVLAVIELDEDSRR